MPDTMMGPVSERYGREVTTVYSGNPLNRLSFLRENENFLNAALHHPTTRFILVDHLNVLVDGDVPQLIWLPIDQSLAELIGDPYKDSASTKAEQWNPDVDAPGATHSQLVFLGVDESRDACEGSNIFEWNGHKGAPRFALDVTSYDHSSDELKKQLEDIRQTVPGEFMSAMFGPTLQDKSEYAIVAEVRMVLDWIMRTRFCAGCGHKTMSAWGGFKLLCPDSLADRTKCPTKGRISNLSFPRTDCCIITAVLSQDGKKVLLGRSRRFRGNMYSTLAGFLESGESIEDCVRREVWEESGVTVGRVLLYGSQPWPYPANIMIGCIAEVAEDSENAHKIHLGHDPELEDAMWVQLADLRRAVAGEDVGFTVPPRSSIAWVLLDAVANGLKPSL